MDNNTAAKKIMVSGIQPSGDLHLGNYLGAIKNWSSRADNYECFYFMADMHNTTDSQTLADLRRRTLEHVLSLIHLCRCRRRGHFRPR